jgi:hypothetical protein
MSDAKRNCESIASWRRSAVSEIDHEFRMASRRLLALSALATMDKSGLIFIFSFPKRSQTPCGISPPNAIRDNRKSWARSTLLAKIERNSENGA